MADPRHGIARADIERYREHARVLADEAHAMLREFFVKGAEVKRKADASYVTAADLAVETRLRELTERAFPDHGVIGEELGAGRDGADFRWIFDPVDGTEEFVHRIPLFGTIVALHYRNAPLVGIIDIPMLDERVEAAFGLGTWKGGERLRLADLDPATPAESLRIMLSARANFARYPGGGARFEAITRACPNHRIYRSCYMHLCATTGQADATIDAGNPIWDIAAAQILIEEAGGAFRIVDTREIGGLKLHNTVFGRPAAVARIAPLLAG